MSKPKETQSARKSRQGFREEQKEMHDAQKQFFQAELKKAAVEARYLEAEMKKATAEKKRVDVLAISTTVAELESSTNPEDRALAEKLTVKRRKLAATLLDDE